jgi:hypothetical protein
MVRMFASRGAATAGPLALTPGGFRSQSLVHSIPPGHGIRIDAGTPKLVDLATQGVAEFPPPPPGAVVPPLHQGRLIATGAPTREVAPGARPALGSGWIVYGWWDSGARPISNFTTTWIVPPAPTTYAAQTIFLFNGIQNTGPNFGILQPVLQYGASAAGGGDYWSIASWYITSAGNAFHTPLSRVAPGQTLVGVMDETDWSGTAYSYDCAFQGVQDTRLPVQNVAPLHWANETLEAYAITRASDYPSSSKSAFTSITISVGTTRPSLSWTAVSRITDCGQRAVTVSDANPGSEIDIYYRSAVSDAAEESHSMWRRA